MNGLGNEFLAFGMLALMCVLYEEGAPDNEGYPPKRNIYRDICKIVSAACVCGMLSIVFISLFRSLR